MLLLPQLRYRVSIPPRIDRAQVGGTCRMESVAKLYVTLAPVITSAIVTAVRMTRRRRSRSRRPISHRPIRFAALKNVKLSANQSADPVVAHKQSASDVGWPQAAPDPNPERSFLSCQGD